MKVTLETECLILRSFELSDCREVQTLAGEYDVAKTTLSIPHPYPDGVAESWITSLGEEAVKGRAYVFAVVKKEAHNLLGCMSLYIALHHQRAELAYWIGKPFWGNGFATEAARRVVAYGFNELQLNKIWAAAFMTNHSSSNVMKNVGMKQEGILKQHVMKWNHPEDLEYYGILRSDYCH